MVALSSSTDADAAAAAAAAVAVVSVTDACMPTALKEAARALSNDHKVKMSVEREKRRKVERGLAKGVADKAKMQSEIDKRGEEENKSGGLVALGARLSAAERDRNELQLRYEKLLNELNDKDQMVGKLNRRLESFRARSAYAGCELDHTTPKKGNGYAAGEAKLGEAVACLPLHIKNELMSIAASAPEDSPLKTGEFWSWLKRSPSPGKKNGSHKGAGYSSNPDGGEGDSNRIDGLATVDEDFETFAALEQLGKFDGNFSPGPSERSLLDAATDNGGAPVISEELLDRHNGLGTPDSSIAGDDHDSGSDVESPLDSSIMRSPTGIGHANKLAEGSADLKEQLRAMIGSNTFTPNLSVARNLRYDVDENDDCFSSDEELEGRKGGKMPHKDDSGVKARGSIREGSSSCTQLDSSGDEEEADEIQRMASSYSPAPSLSKTNPSSTNSDQSGGDGSNSCQASLKEIAVVELGLEKRAREIEVERDEWKRKCTELEEARDKLIARKEEDEALLKKKADDERKASLNLIERKSEKNLSLGNRCRELESERSKLQDILTKLNEEMESDREMSTVKKKNSGAGGYQAGYEQAKEENIDVLRNMSADLNEATDKLRLANKESLKWKRKMEEVLGREESLKRKAAERVKNLSNIISKSGVVGDEIRGLKGDNWTLNEVIWMGVSIVFVMLALFLFSPSVNSGRAVNVK